ncbi:MAG TPA: toprim domain-containing protein, partial [Rhizomicrobium sp.]
HQLRGTAGAAARSYLLSRGLSQEDSRQFRLGYAPPGHHSLVAHLTGNGATTEDIVAAGLARAENGQSVRDFFFDRLMFPIGDSRGRIVAFGARALRDDAKPKYINTGETVLFSKGRLLYNFASGHKAALKSGMLLVAEGYLDVVALVRAGFEAAVAPLGTALTTDQLTLLWRAAPEPVLSFDGDEAGFRAACRAAELGLSMLRPGYSLRFALLPLGDDPDSLIRAHGGRAMKSVLDGAIPLVDMIWRMETEGRDFDTPERKASLLSSLNERSRHIASDDVRRYYLDTFAEKISRQFGLSADVRGNQIRASGKASRKWEPGVRRAPAARRSFAPVSSALKSSKLVPPEASKRTGAVSSADQAGIRLSRPLPPVAPRQSAAEGFAAAAPDFDSTARGMKEVELLSLLLDAPEILERCHETLAALTLADRSLDRLRHELLNLAASGFTLETGRLEDHLVRSGMVALVRRLKTWRAGAPLGSNLGEAEARWLRAAAQLWEMAEAEPERRHALERLKSEATEESWLDWRRLQAARMLPSE